MMGILLRFLLLLLLFPCLTSILYFLSINKFIFYFSNFALALSLSPMSLISIFPTYIPIHLIIEPHCPAPPLLLLFTFLFLQLISSFFIFTFSFYFILTFSSSFQYIRTFISTSLHFPTFCTFYCRPPSL